MRLPSRRLFCSECFKLYRPRASFHSQKRLQHSGNNFEFRLPEIGELDEVEQQKTEDKDDVLNIELMSKTSEKDISVNLSKDANDFFAPQPKDGFTANASSTYHSNLSSSSETSERSGVLQSMTQEDLFTTSNKIDFQKLSQFIKEAYEKRPTEKELTRREESVNIDAILSSYKRESGGSFLKEAAPSFQSRITIQSLDLDLREMLYQKCEAALIQTLTIIDSLQSSAEVYRFYNEVLLSVVDQLKNAKKDRSLNDRFYLRNVFLESNRHEWTELHNNVVERIRETTAADAANFEFNIITLPIITNHVFKKLGYQLFNGDLMFTLFNKLKENVHLYTLCCNQKTYNEILRAIWVYNGNIDLFEFEKVYTEMKFLGYSGDFVTYNILKMVIDEYNAMSNGNSFFNKYGSKVLTRDDNARIAFLTKEFYKLQSNLSNQMTKPDEDDLVGDFQSLR
ncbi:hypothetical protein CANMA_002172 [Candida margitis]|uniref:uncharacterized protein n=1 Tax=Candida margitis TaxID=1775924 RepID=UPI0022277FE3|nr:uncharacterized protein CANMA_002172 [Candida margitis]KAI5968736.1 hypothetical protein CANMA_002172 [Candida margitis]